MKSSVIITIALLFTINVMGQTSQSKRFLIKSGYVKMQLSGNTTGTKEIWWDDYGNKTREEVKSKTEVTVFGMKNVDETNTVTIMQKDKYWVVNKKDNSGQKGTIQYYNDVQKATENMSDEELKRYGEKILTDMGGKKTGTASVLSYNCDIYEIMGTKSWIYKGVVLKSEANVMGIVSTEAAVEFKPNTTVSKTMFDPAANIKYEDLDQLQQQIYGGGDDDYSDDEIDENAVPLTYSYDKFVTGLQKVTSLGYNKIAIINAGDSYVGRYMKNFTSVYTIAALSDQEINIAEQNNAECFDYNKHKACFADDEESMGRSLAIHYPEHKMVIVITGTDANNESLKKILSILSF